MPLWLDPTGLTSYGVGICDRCKEKMSILSLRPDRDNPGLRVCDECNDQLDPYKLPARITEDIALPFTRPDSPLTGFEEPETVNFLLGTEDEDILGTQDSEAIQVSGAIV